jgi:hypothetical protein
VVSANRRQQGDPSKIRDFLPSDKQYLITRNVPCLRRAKNLDYAGLDEVRPTHHLWQTTLHPLR